MTMFKAHMYIDLSVLKLFQVHSLRKAEADLALSNNLSRILSVSWFLRLHGFFNSQPEFLPKYRRIGLLGTSA